MKAWHWLVALTFPLAKVHACRHSIFRRGFKLTALEVQFLVIFGELTRFFHSFSISAILLVLLIINTNVYINSRRKLKAIQQERKHRLLAMYQLQNRTRMQARIYSFNTRFFMFQALLSSSFLRAYYEEQIMPFNAAKQENRTERKVRYALQRKTKSKH
jgi:hypothetical protein